jgi:hypothetical protein
MATTHLAALNPACIFSPRFDAACQEVTGMLFFRVFHAPKSGKNDCNLYPFLTQEYF